MFEIITIIVVNVILYFRTIFYSIVIDDITRRKDVRKLCLKHSLWSSLKSIEYKLYGAGTFFNEKLDHAFTIFLHTVASIMIYQAFGANEVSFIGALIYSVHPVNNQTSMWMNGRRYVINLILVLLIWSLRPWGLLIYAITPMFQINAISTPLLYLFGGYWYLSVLCLMFPFFMKNFLIEKFKSRNSDKLRGSDMTKIVPRKTILMVKTFGYYFWHIIAPLKVVFYPNFYQTYGITKSGNKETYKFNFDFWKGMAALLLCLVAYVLIPSIRFYIFWFVVFILPFCNLITVTQLVADRYTSIAIVGLVMAGAYFLSGNIAVLCIILGIYAMKTWNTQNMYKDIDDFYLYSIYHSPQSILPTIYYAKACMNGVMYYHAYVALRRALVFNPEDMRLLLMLGKTLKLMGHKQAALTTLCRAEDKLDDNIWIGRDELVNDIKRVKEGLK